MYKYIPVGPKVLGIIGRSPDIAPPSVCVLCFSSVQEKCHLGPVSYLIHSNTHTHKCIYFVFSRFYQWNIIGNLLIWNSEITLFWNSEITMIWNSEITMIWNSEITWIWNSEIIMIWNSEITLFWNSEITLIWNSEITLIWNGEKQCYLFIIFCLA